jgi:hypothetical protein
MIILYPIKNNIFFCTICLCFLSILICCSKDNLSNPLIGVWTNSKTDFNGYNYIKLTISEDRVGEMHVISSPTCPTEQGYEAATSNGCEGEIVGFPDEYFINELYPLEWRTKGNTMILIINNLFIKYRYKVKENSLELEYDLDTIHGNEVETLIFYRE